MAKIAGIDSSEYRERAQTALEAARGHGCDALVVLGRGGGPFERHGDLQYITGHYPLFPAIPDQPGHWRLRGHAAAVVTADGTTVVTDDEVAPGSVAADDVRVTPDVLADLAGAGLRGRRVALVGGELLGPRATAALTERLGAEPLALPDLLMPQRLVKSPAEQERLRAASALGAAAIGAALDAARDGASAQQAAVAAYAATVGAGGAVANVFAGWCGPDRPAPRRHFPAYADDAPPAPGDLFLIDMSGALDGYLFDFARTVVFGEDRHGGLALLDQAREVVEATVAALRPGATAADAARTGAAAMAAHGHQLAGAEFPALGHGLGLGFEDPWLTLDNDAPLQAGMCIAVERLLVDGEIMATFEHNVLVTADGAPEVLTARA